VTIVVIKDAEFSSRLLICVLVKRHTQVECTSWLD